MKTDAARAWPIAVQHLGASVLVGIPQRLGNGSLPALGDPERFESLEALAGASWFERTLALLLPRDHAWAWWLPSRSPALARLGGQPMPSRLVPGSLSTPALRRWRFGGTALAVLPPGHASSQAVAVEFAGLDTEPSPEFVWVLPNDGREWEPDLMVRWCRDPSAWQAPSRLPTTGVERVIAMFDGQLHAWLPAAEFPALRRALEELAQSWRLALIDAPPELAWPTPGGPA